MPSNRCPTCKQSVTQLPKMPSKTNPLAELRLGRKLLYTGWWGLNYVLWCVPLGDERPLIVRYALAIKEKQERISDSEASIFKK